MSNITKDLLNVRLATDLCLVKLENVSYLSKEQLVEFYDTYQPDMSRLITQAFQNINSDAFVDKVIAYRVKLHNER